MADMSTTEKTPLHQWTHKSDRVLIVKCVDANGQSYRGFRWPKSGPVKPVACSRNPDCNSGGLFGWAWGLNIGGGKDPDYRGCWIVFSAPPAQVIEVASEKVKVAATTPDEVDAVVEYFGDWAGAMTFTLEGRLAWIDHKTKDAEEKATGERGAASATGESGAASATGESGAASATGWRGAASATDWRGAASATGESGAASATGERGAASATGWSGAASATCWSGAASATGWRGAASATGESGAASATGDSGAASATGESGAASLTGEFGTIEIGPKAAGVCTAREFTWIYRPGAVLLARWDGGHRLFAEMPNCKDGDKVLIRNGEIVS
jgi:hypothetical protein